MLNSELREIPDNKEGIFRLLNAALFVKQAGSKALNIGNTMWPKEMESVAKRMLGIGSKAYVGLEVSKLLVNLVSNPSKIADVPKVKLKQD